MMTSWKRLSTPTKQALILVGMAVLLLIGVLGLTRVVTNRVRSCLDSELYHQAIALRTWFVNESFYLRDEARLLAEFEGFQDLLTQHDEAQLRRLMALHQSTHEADNVYLLTATGKLYTAAAKPPLDADTVWNLDLVQMGFNGQALAELTTVDNRIWLIAVAPHVQPTGETDAVFVIVRQMDASFLETLVGGFNGMIILTDGKVWVGSRTDHMPQAVFDSLTKAINTQRGDLLQPYSVRFDGATYEVLVAPLGATHSGTYALALVKQAEVLDDARRDAWLWGLGLASALGLFVVLLVWFHEKEVFAPLRNLSQTAQRLANGELDEPVEPTGVADVQQLAEGLETLRTQMQALLTREQALSKRLEARLEEQTQALEQVCRARENLLAQLISSQEEERRRVSRELHDETSQELANLIVRLGALARMVDDEDILEQLRGLRNRAAQTLEGVNRIVMDLRPGLLDEYGLVPAVQWYADARLSPQGIDVKVKAKGTPRDLTPYVQVSVYRVLQEAINNIARHAQAKHVTIRFDWRDNFLRIEVEDDGQGFDVESALADAQEHFGLLGMKERIALLNGKMHITSQPGQGTRLVFHIPYALHPSESHDGQNQSLAG
ncbi:MAG: HAMP domain-containing protein [Chloroflexi bacterium]|nr:HAMP domain-containing protein [Chloroflexota bacterium]